MMFEYYMASRVDSEIVLNGNISIGFPNFCFFGMYPKKEKAWTGVIQRKART